MDQNRALQHARRKTRLRFIWLNCATPARQTILRSEDIAPISRFGSRVWQKEHISVHSGGLPPLSDKCGHEG